jgi:general secretion pathway protein G
MNFTKPKLARRAATRGMTLIEILVVLAIIGLIMGGVAVVAVNAMTQARIDTTRTDIGNLTASVEMYQLQKKGKCPKTVQDLKAAGLIKKANQDAWGNDFVLKCPGEHDGVDISSAGPDGEFGNEDDINSWDAEQADAGEAEKE